MAGLTRLSWPTRWPGSSNRLTITAISARVAEPLGSKFPPFLPVKTPAAYILCTASRNSASTAFRSGMVWSLIAGRSSARSTFANRPASSCRVMVFAVMALLSGHVEGRSFASVA